MTWNDGSAAPDPSSCAAATTLKEAAFRLDYALAAARNTRVIALDDGAEHIVREVAELPWSQARFYVCSDPGYVLVEVSGESVDLVDALTDCNTVVFVTTSAQNADAVGRIGAACEVRGIMTAGLVITPDASIGNVLRVLRPYTRMLLAPADIDDLVELLGATRA